MDNIPENHIPFVVCSYGLLYDLSSEAKSYLKAYNNPDRFTGLPEVVLKLKEAAFHPASLQLSVYAVPSEYLKYLDILQCQGREIAWVDTDKYILDLISELQPNDPDLRSAVIEIKQIPKNIELIRIW